MVRDSSVARCFYDSMYRRQMLRNEGMAPEFVSIHSPAVDVRGYEYRQRLLIFYMPDIEAIVEGDSWAPLLCRVRVPVPVA